MGRGEAYDYYATSAIAEAMLDWDQSDVIHSHLSQGLENPA